jgi:RNA polymerase sigma factor (sigma-70 family)
LDLMHMKSSHTSSAGEEGEFSSFFKSYYLEAVKTVKSMHGIDLDTAEELAQDAFVSIYRTLGKKFDGMSVEQRRSYFIKTAKNKYTDLWRLRLREALAEEAQDPCCSCAEEEFRAVEVRDAIERLPSELREIAAMRYLAGFTVPEIAKITELNNNTVGSRLRRIRKYLADQTYPRNYQQA